MQNANSIRQTETAKAALATCGSTFSQLAPTRTCHRKILIRLALPRRRPCLAKRAIVAALREAELAAWLASGGDFLQTQAN